MRLGRVAMLAAFVAGGLLLLGAPVVAVAPKFAGLVPSSFQEVYNSADGRPGGQTVTARCPFGMSAVSIGGGGGLPLGSIALGADAASAVAMTSATPTDPSTDLISVVTCAPAAQFFGTTFATTSQYRPNGALWSATAVCPAGMRAFGGGGYFKARNGQPSTTFQLMTTNSVVAGGRSWKVDAVNPLATDTLVVTTRCALQSSSTRLVEASYPMVATPGVAGVARSGYAHCPPGYLPLSGGASITTTSPAGSSLAYSVPVRNGQIGWFAHGKSIDPNARLHVIALCGVD